MFTKKPTDFNSSPCLQESWRAIFSNYSTEVDMYGSNSATLEKRVLVRSPVSAISPSLSSQPRPHDFSILWFFSPKLQYYLGSSVPRDRAATKTASSDVLPSVSPGSIYTLPYWDRRPWSSWPCLIWIVNLELRSPSLQRQLLSPIRLFLSTNKKPVSSVPPSLGIFLINFAKNTTVNIPSYILHNSK